MTNENRQIFTIRIGNDFRLVLTNWLIGWLVGWNQYDSHCCVRSNETYKFKFIFKLKPINYESIEWYTYKFTYKLFSYLFFRVACGLFSLPYFTLSKMLNFFLCCTILV